MTVNQPLRCMSIEAKDLYNAKTNHDPDNISYNIRDKNGVINLRKFNAVYDWSLDSMKLQEVYEKRMRKRDFAFKFKRHWYTKNVVCVTFNYSYKNFNPAGKNTYVKAGYTYRDCTFTDGTCFVDGVLVGIQTNIEIMNPRTQEELGEYFTFDGECYKQKKPFKVVMDKAGLRNCLYEEGFSCDGVEYVRYKRSSGSSRVGKCLFVNKELAEDMRKWDSCGLEINDGDQIDLAAYESYISLPMSSIIDTIHIPMESILVIDDYESEFEDDVVSVWVEGEHLDAGRKKQTISNSIFDGQSLLDESMFTGKYKDKGMILLRNRFFKSCCFNANIQKFFEDNGITEIYQLKGFTMAESVKDIKMITTPSSIKFAKFGRIQKWMQTVDDTFGIVKYEKPTHYFDGEMVQCHYQLLNTLHFSYSEIEEILRPSLEYVSAIRRDPAVLRYQVKFPEEVREREPNSIKSKNEIIFKLLGINDRFAKTKLYYDFRDDLIKGEMRNLKQGHVLVKGNYSTMMGNGLEMLKASIGLFTGESELSPGCIHSTRFGYGKELLCSRSPHVCSGNIMLVRNEENSQIDRYLNLTPEIVYVNAINENIQQRLNG